MSTPPTIEVVAERLAALEKLILEREKGRNKALELQAREYERRLVDLNHEAARLKSAAELAVSVEKYDAERAADHNRVSELDRRVQEVKESLLTIVVQRAAQAKWIALAISVGVAVVNIIVTFFLARGVGQ